MEAGSWAGNKASAFPSGEEMGTFPRCTWAMSRMAVAQLYKHVGR